jgi:hypothetical protein
MPKSNRASSIACAAATEPEPHAMSTSSRCFFQKPMPLATKVHKLLPSATQSKVNFSGVVLCAKTTRGRARSVPIPNARWLADAGPVDERQALKSSTRSKPEEESNGRTRPFYRALGRMSRVSAQRGCRSADQKFRDSSAIDLDSETGAGRDLDPAGLPRYRFSQNLHPHRMLGLIELE